MVLGDMSLTSKRNTRLDGLSDGQTFGYTRRNKQYVSPQVRHVMVDHYLNVIVISETVMFLNER